MRRVVICPLLELISCRIYLDSDELDEGRRQCRAFLGLVIYGIGKATTSDGCNGSNS